MAYPSLLQQLMQDEGAGTSLKNKVLPNNYAVCYTNPEVQIKTVDIHDFVLVTGATVFIKFTQQDTAGNCYLKVSNTEAKLIKVNGAPLVSGFIDTNKVYQFIYDGIFWCVVSGSNVMHTTTDEVIHGDKTFTGSITGNIDASNINSGVLSLDRIPQGAIETLVPVADIAARFSLTVDQVQIGDTVKQNDTGVLYLVVDESKLDSEEGYVEYKSGISLKLGSETLGNQVTPIYLVEGTATKCDEYVPRSGGQFTGNLSITGETTLYDNLTVAGDTSITSNLSVTGTTTVSNNLSVGGNTTVTGTVTSPNFIGNADTATILATKRAIDGVQFNGSSNIIHYAQCSTASNIAAKVVSLPGFILGIGSVVYVKFNKADTAGNCTLNVSNTGAKRIVSNGLSVAPGFLLTDQIYSFIYDGSVWSIAGGGNLREAIVISSSEDVPDVMAKNSLLISTDWANSTVANSTSQRIGNIETSITAIISAINSITGSSDVDFSTIINKLSQVENSIKFVKVELESKIGILRTSLESSIYNDTVHISGDETISGTKTFSTVPVVGTLDYSDNSNKAASTKFVQELVSNSSLSELYGYVHLTDVDESIQGVKTFESIPQVPTANLSSRGTDIANTEFVQSNIDTVVTSTTSSVLSTVQSTIQDSLSSVTSSLSANNFIGEIKLWYGEVSTNGYIKVLTDDTDQDNLVYTENIEWHVCDGTLGTPELSFGTEGVYYIMHIES